MNLLTNIFFLFRQCGSCWAFSATEQTESMSCLDGNTGGKYIQNSMQQVVDCDTTSYGKTNLKFLNFLI
jgi:C1A family cysteine protease